MACEEVSASRSFSQASSMHSPLQKTVPSETMNQNKAFKVVSVKYFGHSKRKVTNKDINPKTELTAMTNMAVCVSQAFGTGKKTRRQFGAAVREAL